MAVKPKLAMIPSGVGTDTLYSVLPTDGTGDFTFDRNLNTATRVNKDGLIEMVDADVPRLNYPLIDGVVSGCPSLLLEPASTNVVTYSEDFSNAVWGEARLSVSANQVISPNGTLNADYIEQENGNASSGGIFVGVNFTAAKYTQSIFVKKKEKSFITLTENASSSSLRYTWFDIENGVIGTINGGHTAKIENYGNDWYRCSITYTAINTGSGYSAFYYLADADGSLTVSGSGGLYVWGAMVEQGSYATSYIPTENGIATRSAETCNNSGDANTFNDSEGVLMAEISALANDGTFRFISLSDGTLSNRISLFFSTSNTLNASANGISSIGGVLGIENNNKVAFKYKSGDYALWVNGIEVGTLTATNGNHANLNRLNFDYGQGSDDFYGNTKQLQYFDTALTDTDLEELTSWSSFNEMANAQLYTII